MVTAKFFIKHLSVWLPFVMSFSALLLVLGYVLLFGIDQKPMEDEGTPARIFQLLLAVQVPVIAFFAIKYFPQNSKRAAIILALQILAALVPFTLVFFLEL